MFDCQKVFATGCTPSTVLPTHTKATYLRSGNVSSVKKALAQHLSTGLVLLAVLTAIAVQYILLSLLCSDVSLSLPRTTHTNIEKSRALVSTRSLRSLTREPTRNTVHLKQF